MREFGFTLAALLVGVPLFGLMRALLTPWVTGRRWLHAHADSLGVSWSWFERSATIRVRLRETWLRWSPGTVLALERAVASVPGVSRVDVREDRRVVVRIKRRWFTKRQEVLGRVRRVVDISRPVHVRCDVEEG